MARMTKADIIEAVYEKVGGFSKKEAAEIVETVFNVVKETLERGEKIKISGFGNFVVRDKNSRVGRNPQTGKEITISARRVRWLADSPRGRLACIPRRRPAAPVPGKTSGSLARSGSLPFAPAVSLCHAMNVH